MDNTLFLDSTSILVFIVVGLISYVILRQCRRPFGIPPGPPLWPILGNISAVSGKNLIEALRDIRKEYGDIYCLKLGSSWVLVINGLDNLKEALIKQGDMFSDRPNTFFFNRLLDNTG